MRIPFAILTLIAAVTVYFMHQRHYQEELVIYGFAETKETEINLNHAIQISSIKVVPGQQVKKGDLLLKTLRLNEDQDFDDVEMRVSEIQTKHSARRKDFEGKLQLLKTQYEENYNTIQADIQLLDEKIALQKDLYEGLQTVQQNTSSKSPNILQRQSLLGKQNDLKRIYEQEKMNLEQNLIQGEREDKKVIQRLRAGKVHKSSISQIPVDLYAPTDGLIGNVHVKVGEHISDFRTLISFYEPNPSLAKAYVLEEQLVNVNLGDRFSITSTNDETHSYEASVSGLGSRIVEIPVRMRKVPSIKSYGREVIFQLPAQSKFLQNEKLVLSALYE